MVSPPSRFYDQAYHIRGPQTNFTVSRRPSNSLLAIFIILELKHWTTGGSTKSMGNLSSAFESRQQLGTNIQELLRSWQRTAINIISASKFHLNRVGNGNDNISSEEHFTKICKPREVRIYY
jgi:hypothetical protein